MQYTPPEPWGREGSGHLQYSVARTAVIHLDGIDFLVQQHVRDYGYSYYYIVVRGRITDQFQRQNGKGPETVYCLEPADPKYRSDIEGLLKNYNIRGRVEFSQFPSSPQEGF